MFLKLLLLTIFIIKNHAMTNVSNNLYALNDNAYYIEPEPKFTWFQAFIKCARQQMSLVTIDTPAKSFDIQQILRSNFKSINPLWIGALLESENPLQYAWTANGQNLTFTNWAIDQPTFTGHRDYCIQIAEEDATGYIKWNDERCSRNFGFICEVNPRNLEVEKLKEKLRQNAEIQQQLQNELNKSKTFIQFLMDYRKPEFESSGNRTIRDIILNIN